MYCAHGCGVKRIVTPKERALYQSVTLEIENLESNLKEAIRTKQRLAETLYKRYGKSASYKVGDEYLVVCIARSGTYHFAPRIRWPKEARAAKAEKRRLDRIARLQSLPVRQPADSTGRASTEVSHRVDLTAILRSKSSPGDETRSDHGDAGEESECAPCGGVVGSPSALSSQSEGAVGRSPQAGGVALSTAVQDFTPKVPRRHTPGAHSDNKHHLPVVVDVGRPRQAEPRLLQIREPSEVKEVD